MLLPQVPRSRLSSTNSSQQVLGLRRGKPRPQRQGDFWGFWLAGGTMPSSSASQLLAETPPLEASPVVVEPAIERAIASRQSIHVRPRGFARGLGVAVGCSLS